MSGEGSVQSLVNRLAPRRLERVPVILQLTPTDCGAACLAMALDGPNHFRNPTRKPARYLVALANDPLAARRRP